MPAASLSINSPFAAPECHRLPGTCGPLVEKAYRRPVRFGVFGIRTDTRRSTRLARDNEFFGLIDGQWAWDAVLAAYGVRDILERHAQKAAA